MLNSIEGTLKNHANAINQNSETMSCLDKELLKTKIEFKSKLTKITLKTQNNHLNTVKNTSEIEKNIQSLKKNTFTKPRNSKKREQKISTIEKGFKLFITELENFPNYNSEEKIIDYKKYELSELQAYQTLIEFFRKNYEVPLDQTYSIMFGIFNLHFNIKGKELKSNNWDDFKKRLLPDIENNTLISDLYLNIKK